MSWWKTIFCPQNDFVPFTFQKTKYFGSQNSSNHLSEVAVEKNLFGFPHVFWKLEISFEFHTSFTLIETHFYLAKLGRELRFGSL